MNGWTGGQYSLFRAVFGLYLLQSFTRLFFLDLGLEPVLLTAMICGGLASFALIAGWRDRIAAVVLAVAWIVAFPGPLLNVAIPCLLLLHALLPAAPYGSWAARDRPDPRGGWRMPPAIYLSGWIVLILAYVQAFAEPSRGFGAVALLHLFTFDPRWIPQRLATRPERMFYDGHCGLCHRSVRMVLAEDRSGHALRFAPIDSDAFRAEVPIELREQLPDSVIIRREDGELLVRSAALLQVLALLGGLWRLLGAIIGVVPRSLLDRGYDFIAAIRHRLFSAPDAACPLVPPELRQRFDL